jgi:hypothetical protein
MAINTLDKNLQHIPWTLESAFNRKLDWLKFIIETNQQVLPYNNHVGTGIPELTIDRQTNQKVPKIPPTRDRHNSQDGK